MTKKVKVKELEEDGRCYVAKINVDGHLKMMYQHLANWMRGNQRVLQLIRFQ